MLWRELKDIAPYMDFGAKEDTRAYTMEHDRIEHDCINHEGDWHSTAYGSTWNVILDKELKCIAQRTKRSEGSWSQMLQ